jgi:hypothetical protein
MSLERSSFWSGQDIEDVPLLTPSNGKTKLTVSDYLP